MPHSHNRRVPLDLTVMMPSVIRNSSSLHADTVRGREQVLESDDRGGHPRPAAGQGHPDSMGVHV